MNGMPHHIRLHVLPVGARAADYQPETRRYRVHCNRSAESAHEPRRHSPHSTASLAANGHIFPRASVKVYTYASCMSFGASDG
jgi:hypothetical protein